MSDFEIRVLSNGNVIHAVPLQGNALRVGRAPANDLVVADDGVSWHHAQVWVEGQRAWIHDLASRNGTYVNDERVRAPTSVNEGDRIRLGDRVELRVRGGSVAVIERAIQLEDLDAGICFPIRSDRLYIGSGEDAHLRINDAASRCATVGIGPDGELWLGVDDAQRPLQIEEEFQVAGRRLRVIESQATHAPTVEFGAHEYPYRAVARQGGPSGPEVLLSDLEESRTKLFTRNRGLLLFLLAKQLHSDRGEGMARDAEGWCNDMDVAVGIWGRRVADANKLHVLIHRLRKAIGDAGFEPWCVEKRQWGVRVRLSEVRLE